MDSNARKGLRNTQETTMSVFARVAVAAALLFGIAGMAAGLGLAADVAHNGAVVAPTAE
jgi:hypothetical protein